MEIRTQISWKMQEKRLKNWYFLISLIFTLTLRIHNLYGFNYFPRGCVDCAAAQYNRAFQREIFLISLEKGDLLFIFFSSTLELSVQYVINREIRNINDQHSTIRRLCSSNIYKLPFEFIVFNLQIASATIGRWPIFFLVEMIRIEEGMLIYLIPNLSCTYSINVCSIFPDLNIILILHTDTPIPCLVNKRLLTTDFLPNFACPGCQLGIWQKI